MIWKKLFIFGSSIKSRREEDGSVYRTHLEMWIGGLNEGPLGTCVIKGVWGRRKYSLRSFLFTKIKLQIDKFVAKLKEFFYGSCNLGTEIDKYWPIVKNQYYWKTFCAEVHFNFIFI